MENRVLRIATRLPLAGLVRHGIYAGKGNKRLFALKTTDVPNLRHELRTKGFPYAVHLHDNRVIREHGGQAVHLGLVNLHRPRKTGELAGGFLYKHLGYLRPGNKHNDGFGAFIHLCSVLVFENIAVLFAPFTVSFGKGLSAVFPNAVGVPEGINEIHHFCVTSLRTGLSKHLRIPGKDSSSRAIKLFEGLEAS